MPHQTQTKQNKQMRTTNMVDAIIAYECGELDGRGIVSLFGDLIRSGAAWSLQGHYGRTAQAMIERGLISRDGDINTELLEELCA